MPLATDDTGTQGAAKFQLETGLQMDWDRQDEHRTTGQATVETVTGGVSDSIDLIAAYSYTRQSVKNHGVINLDNSGFNDLSLGVKWRFLEAGQFNLAIHPTVAIPTASYNRGLGAGRPSYNTTLISTIDLKPVVVSANVGYTYRTYPGAASDTGHKNLLNLSLATTAAVTPHLQLMAEIVGYSNPGNTSSAWPVFMTGGASYSLMDSLDVDLGIRGGLTSTATDISLLTGCTVRF
jgi:hypothetical protein